MSLSLETFAVQPGTDFEKNEVAPQKAYTQKRDRNKYAQSLIPQTVCDYNAPGLTSLRV